MYSLALMGSSSRLDPTILGQEKLETECQERNCHKFKPKNATSFVFFFKKNMFKPKNIFQPFMLKAMAITHGIGFGVHYLSP